MSTNRTALTFSHKLILFGKKRQLEIIHEYIQNDRNDNYYFHKLSKHCLNAKCVSFKNHLMNNYNDDSINI